MAIREKVNPNEDEVVMAGGVTASGVIGCAAKYGAAQVVEGGMAALTTVAEVVPAVKIWASFGVLLGEVLCPEVVIIGGLIALGKSLLECD